MYRFEYSSNLHSTGDTNDNDESEDNDYYSCNGRYAGGNEQIDLEIDKNLDIQIVTDGE